MPLSLKWPNLSKNVTRLLSCSEAFTVRGVTHKCEQSWHKTAFQSPRVVVVKGFRYKISKLFGISKKQVYVTFSSKGWRYIVASKTNNKRVPQYGNIVNKRFDKDTFQHTHMLRCTVRCRMFFLSCCGHQNIAGKTPRSCLIICHRSDKLKYNFRSFSLVKIKSRLTALYRPKCFV